MLRFLGRFFGASLLIGIGFLSLFSCSPGGKESPPRAEHGVLDLRSWSFVQKPLVELAGDWDFYWDILSVDPPTKAAVTAPIPGRWSSLAVDGHPLPANGRGTYRLKIILPPGEAPLGLRLNQVDRGYRLYSNGQELPTGFTVSGSASGEGGTGTTRYFLLTPVAGTLEISLLVSSHFDSWGGGIPLVPILGTPEAVAEHRAWQSSYEMFLVGLLLIMGLYHLMLFFNERKDKALVVFALICFTSLVRQMVTDESFLVTLLRVNDDLIRRLAWLSPYLLVALFLLFYDFFFPWSKWKRISLVLKLYGFVLAALCLFANQGFYSFGPLQHYYILVSIGFVCAILVRGMLRREPYALVLLVGSICLALPAVIDIFSTMSGGFWTYLYPVGTIPFLLTLSHALARRYTQGTRDAESLRVKNSQLAELDQSKTNFFANVSHELRTPLTLILGPLEGIQKGAFGAELPHSHPVFALMKRNTSRILKLVENLLKIARIESALPAEPVALNLAETLKNYLEEFQAVAESGKVTLKLVNSLTEGENNVLLDPQDFETILLNLLSNALKYTPPGGAVNLRVSRRTAAGKDRLVIGVEDTGIGMGEYQLAKLFQRFTRVYDTERGSFGGTGIGLSIAREAALRLGGDLSARSQAGFGSVFTLEIPFTAAQGASAALSPNRKAVEQMASDLSVPQFSIEWPPGEKTEKHDRKKILVVEDNPELRGFLSAFLETDFQVLSASDGLEALGTLDREKGIELIISDIMMPRMDGLKFFQAVRDRSLPVPFLFLTAVASDREKLENLRNGALDYLLKPFSPEELKARIYAILDWQDRGRQEFKKKLLAVLDDPAPALTAHDLTSYGFSPRELEVLEQLAQGSSDKEIAGTLGLSQRTVSNHVGNLLKKTGKKSRGELMGLYLGEARLRP